MTLPAYDDRREPLVPFAREAPYTLAGGVAREAGRLTIAFDLVAPHEALRLAPRAAAPRRRDELWRHTCFEAFLAPASGAAYWEVNVAPSGDWNVYRFTGYRAGMSAEPRVREVETACDGVHDGTLRVRAALDVAAIPDLASGPLDVGLAAVLESGAGALAYFALSHARERPDFHRREGFTMRVA